MTSVVVGRLHAVDDYGFTLGGGVQIRFSPGVTLPPGCKLGVSLTVTAVGQDGALRAQEIRITPEPKSQA